MNAYKMAWLVAVSGESIGSEMQPYVSRRSEVGKTELTRDLRLSGRYHRPVALTPDTQSAAHEHMSDPSYPKPE